MSYFNILSLEKLKSALLVGLTLSPFASYALAADLLGAETVVAAVKKATDTLPSTEQKSESGKIAAEKLLRDIENFKLERNKLSAKEAVGRWMGFYARFQALPSDLVASWRINPQRLARSDSPSLKSLILALPPPAAWDTLRSRLVEQAAADNTLRNTALEALGHFLTQDRAGVEKVLAKMKADAAMSGNSSSSYALQRFDTYWGQQKLRMRDEPMASAFDAYLQVLQGARLKGQTTVQVPDLITLSDEKHAEETLLKALAIPGLSLSVPSGGATLDLAKRLVRENAEKLNTPQWALVTSIEDTALYEALSKKFPDAEESEKNLSDFFQLNSDEFAPEFDNDARRNADFFYVMGLIAANRVQDAAQRATKIEPDDFKKRSFNKLWLSFDKVRFAPQLRQFCKNILADRPELPLWQQCGLMIGSPEEAVEFLAIIDKTAQKSDTSPEFHLGLIERKADFLLAMDREEDAITLLRDALKDSSGDAPSQTKQAAAQTKLKLAARLAVLGNLLARPELVRASQQVFAATFKNTDFKQQFDSFYQSSSPFDHFIDALLENGNYPAAEELVQSAMLAALDPPELAMMPSKAPDIRAMALGSGILSPYLMRLAEIYDRAGRPNDVIALLDQAPWWGTTDLIGLADRHKKLPTLAAKALHAAGRDDEAVRILKAHLQGHPGDDSAYQILTDLLGPSIIPWLDTLQTQDRFEERPMIWKAVLLKKAGALEQAEATIRQALKIDPTDGEQKADDRGRAYAVLAEILKDRGKMDDAAFFDRVVASIRIAEKGDKLSEAGLLRRSLPLYEEASTNFADAYCVQWRLAERLSAMGKLEEARKHYQIAFERMPEQFGQVARFCFGCEGVFTNQQSTTVAEEVLTRLAKATPDKPQIHYLLGQLRESQGRKLDAYHHFHAAAALDPDYLDALKAIYALRKDVLLSQAETDAIALRLVKLDPLNRHNQINTEEIADLKKLWILYADLAPLKMPLPKELMTLAASKKNLDGLTEKFGGNQAWFQSSSDFFQERRSIPEPGEAVANNGFVQRLLFLNTD